MSVDLLLAPPAAEGFHGAWPVRTGDVDRRNRLRLDGVARYLQDMAWDNLHDAKLTESDPFWIVRRTVIDVLRPVVKPDHVELQRWCSGLSTHWANMRTRITSERGGLIETEGFWINIGESTGRPARISDKGAAYLAETATEHRLRWKALLSEPPPQASATDADFPLRGTDIDQFNHLNNAAYWHAVEEQLLDLPKLIARPHRAVIEYLAPVLPREHVTVRSRRVGDTLELWFLVDEEVRTIARVAALRSSRRYG